MIAALVNKLAVMYLYALVGFVLARAKVMDERDSRTLSSLTVYVLQPCLIFSAMQIEMTPDRIHGFAAATIFGLLIYLIWILLSYGLSRPLHLTMVEQATLVYGNVGNLVMPLVSMMLGSEMIFYASAMQIPFHLFIWSHGTAMIRGDGRIELKRIFRNSNMIALILGLLAMVSGLKLPAFIDTALDGFTACVGPVSMFVIGMAVARANLKDIFTFKRGYFITLLGQVIYPILALLLLLASGYLTRHPEYTTVFLTIFITLAAPPASTTAQLAILYDRHATEASIYNVMGTLLCLVTMPLCIALFQAVFMRV